jgi:hypothetical protein
MLIAAATRQLLCGWSHSCRESAVDDRVDRAHITIRVAHDRSMDITIG